MLSCDTQTSDPHYKQILQPCCFLEMYSCEQSDTLNKNAEKSLQEHSKNARIHLCRDPYKKLPHGGSLYLCDFQMLLFQAYLSQ